MALIYVRGHYDNYNSYGILATAIVEGLLHHGHNVRCIPTKGTDYKDTRWHTVKHDVISPLLIGEGIRPPAELCIMSPATAILKKNNVAPTTVRLTMFESPRLDPYWIKFENTCRAMILPNEGNAIGFHAAGVIVPFYTVPLGYDDRVYRYSPMDMQGKCVFGLGGRIHPITDKRKGASEAVEIFQKAFPNEQDVELQIKTLNCDPVVVNPKGDNRIKVISELYSLNQLFNWYKGLTAYLSLSRSEGWGLMQHEAMVVGRPVISTRFLGIKEFIRPECMYEVGFTTEQAKVHPDGFSPGIWTKPNVDDVISQMRAVYRNRMLAAEKGKQANLSVRHLTWNNTAAQILKVLRKLEVI
jgi:glycosyltransferase involved in cell wall biosynthesis